MLIILNAFSKIVSKFNADISKLLKSARMKEFNVSEKLETYSNIRVVSEAGGEFYRKQSP